MNTAAKRLLSSRSFLLQRPSHVHQQVTRTILKSTTTGWMIQRQPHQQQQRYGHGGVIDPHRLRYGKGSRKVPSNKLLQAIRKGDQQAVWTQYLMMHENNQLKHLLPEYHSMTLRALGLQNLIAYGPDEIVAIKERLLMIWENMKHFGVAPDIRDYNHMLGFAGRASDWTLCQRIWRELMAKSSTGSRSSLWGLAPNVYSYNAYMVATIQCNQAAKVAVIFNNMQQQAGIQPNTFSYNTLMDAYGHLGDVAEVDRIFDRVFIRQQQQQQQSPKHRISSLLHPQRQPNTALGREVAFISRRAPSVQQQQQQNQLVPTADTFMALIDAHGRLGNTMGLEMIYSKMMPEFNMTPTLPIYNALIRWYCNKSDIASAKKLLVDMKTQGIEPNVVTFNHVFRHEAIKRNRPGVAEKILDFMHQMYQLRPLESMYRHLIRIHNRHSRDQEVERLVRTYETSMKSSSSK
ncbi:hypothetical protein BCR42DRAFT_422957 [Absidia repens]|uniref:Pentacotripeptide-repeat region of PRORP domain-containing protein n=1 Tax=Absidia repens TaxID=90262 RepID=A0A1X2I6H6_9FUNG|nr:hypothetical protein BCR42DRAFT_422957 [Absidia repens]